MLALTALAACVVMYVLFDWFRASRIWPEPAPPELSRLAPVMAPEADAAKLLGVAIEGAKTLDRPALQTVLELPLRVKVAPRVPEPRNPAVDNALDDFLGTSGVQLPIPSIADPGPDYTYAIGLYELRAGRAIWRWLSGNTRGAWQDMAAVIELGQRIQHGAGSMLVAAIGLAIERRALGLIENVLTSGTEAWGPGMGAVAVAVERGMKRPPAVEAAIVAECIFLEDAYRTLGHSGQRSAERLDGEPVDSSYQFDLVKTRAFARAQCYRWLKAARLPPHQRNWPAAIHLFRDAPTVGRYFDNPVGRVLIELTNVPWQRFIEDSDHVRASRARLRLMLALAQWRASNAGANPDELEALVPDYLKTVPVNVVSGRSFDYDPQSGLIAELVRAGENP